MKTLSCVTLLLSWFFIPSHSPSFRDSLHQLVEYIVNQSSTFFLSTFQMYITSTVKARGTRLAKPVLCLGLMCLAFLTGINRVAEYRNHWSDVIAGFVIGISIAVFLVSVYLCHFCWKNISILVCIS